MWPGLMPLYPQLLADAWSARLRCAGSASANIGEVFARHWGSSGRRFKSCQPDNVMSQDIGIAVDLL
jgi:hypothetical protein